MAYNSDSEPHKRKREISDDNGSQVSHSDRIPQPPPPQSGNHVPINYLSRAQTAKLRLIQGDSDTFSDVLSLINEYEGVLTRHESLASNLGAKLTGPRLLKAMEAIFEGRITIHPPQAVFSLDPITWLDIVEFAKSKPSEFNLTPAPGGFRSCSFPLKGVLVEISEDDWRLIKSGAMDRFNLAPQQPLEEDETAEMATLEILEHRLQILIKRADEVARKARQLNYHLSGRKASITGRRGSRPSTPGPGFQSVNQTRSQSTNVGYDLHSDLLQQFLSPAQGSGQGMSSAGSLPPTPGGIGSGSFSARGSSSQQQPQQQQTLVPTGRPSPVYHTETGPKESEGENRSLVTTKIDKLARGDIIQPPCDRCRRLKTHCIKHLTACQGCTKKHARCVWKSLTEEEVAWLRGEAGGSTTSGGAGGDNGDEIEDGRDTVRSFGPSHTDLEDPRREDRLDMQGASWANRQGPRLALGRHADDMWRKGPTPSSRIPRHDTMDVDPRDPGPLYEQQHGEQSGYLASTAAAAPDTPTYTDRRPS